MNKSRLSAKQVQKLLNVEDGEIIAYGYNFDRNSVRIFFRNGFLYKEIFCTIKDREEILTTHQAYEFDPEMFFKDIKRFYENKTNFKLIELFNTFYPGGLNLC